MFLSQARGKVGSVVFAVTKGQQIARVYNPKPANPRSTGQQAQRALLANMTKFYKRATQNFYKFAYENKSARESDYNAFARENINRGVYFEKAMYDSPYVPALGRYVITRGSLAKNYSCYWFAEVFGFTCPGLTSPTTVGHLSAGMLENNPSLREGDIFTMVIAFSAFEPRQIYAEYTPDWRIIQFRLDNTSIVPLTDYMIKYDVNAGSFYYEDPDSYGGLSNCAMGAVVISRETAEGLKVTDTEITLSSAAGVTTDWLTGMYARKVAAVSWGAEGDAILQGSLAQDLPEITGISGFTTQTGYKYTDALVNLDTPATSHVYGKNLKTSATGTWRLRFYSGEDLDTIEGLIPEFVDVVLTATGTHTSIDLNIDAALKAALDPYYTVGGGYPGGQGYYLLTYEGVPIAYGALVASHE